MTTITFAGGSFDSDNPSIVTKNGPNEYTLSTSDGSAFSDLQVRVVDEPINLTVEGNVGQSGFEMGADSDVLVIAGEVKDTSLSVGDGNNKLRSERIAFSTYDANDGNNKTVLDGARTVSKDSTFTSGSGKDVFKFKGNVKGSLIAPGEGRDTLIFGGKIKNTQIDLGGDGVKDTIKIKDGLESVKSLRITGADDGDVLIIGSSEFEYSTADALWVSTDDPNETLSF
jgi:hypothetical protein